MPRRALRDMPVPRPPARAEALRPEPARAEPEYEAVPPAAVAQSVTDAYPEPVAEQPDMFAPTAVEPPRQPAERPRAPQPAPRFEARPQPEAARPRVVAHVDDIEPQRSSPERTIRTGEARTGDPQRDPPSRTQRPSIFNLWRGRRSEGEMPRSAPEAPTVRSRQAEPVAPTPLRPAQPQAEPAPRAAGPMIENQARRAKEDDVLEIPAFLRRQAN
jgi:cell division protein FtsZ